MCPGGLPCVYCSNLTSAVLQFHLRGMICVFELPDKSLREFMWHARPLGLSFGTASPPVVSKVERPADVKGIKEGYILRRFGSDFRSLETTEDQSTSKILADMQKFANLLPDATLQDVKEW